MLQARKRLKRVQNHSQSLIWVSVLAFIISLSVLPSSSPAATVVPPPTRGLMAMSIKSSMAREKVRTPPVLLSSPRSLMAMSNKAAWARTKSRTSAAHPASSGANAPAVATELTGFTSHPTPTEGYVVTLIHRDFPVTAWHDAEAVAWCESKFRTTDIGFDSNGTHDRGLFQLNDGGTEQYLMAMIHQNPQNLNLAFNPVLNVRAAALLYRRDGWSQWSCASAI
jgi:hypothetical protein